MGDRNVGIGCASIFGKAVPDFTIVTCCHGVGACIFEIRFMPFGVVAKSEHCQNTLAFVVRGAPNCTLPVSIQ